MVDSKTMPDGLTRLPQEYRKTNEGIERLIQILSKNGGDAGKLAETYREEFRKLAEQQAENQKKANIQLEAMRKAGVSKTEREAWVMRKSGLYEGDRDLHELMKSMQEELRETSKSIKISDETEQTIADAQMRMLEKYLKNQDAYFQNAEKRANTIDKDLEKERKDAKKPKAAKWLEEKSGKFFGEKAEGAKEGAKTGARTFGSVALTTLLGPLRLLTDPLLSLAGTSTSEVFDKLLEPSSDEKTKKKGSKSVLGRYESKRNSYGEEYDFDEGAKKKSSKDADDDWASVLKALEGDEEGGIIGASANEGEGKKKKTAGKPRVGGAGKKQKKNGIEDFLSEGSVPGLFDNGKESSDLEGIMDSISPTRSNLLKRGGIIGASAIFLADALLGGEGKPGMDAEGGDGKKSGVLDFLGLGKGGLGKTGIKGMMTKLLPALKVAVPVAVAAAGVAMVAGGLKLQKRDTADAKKYADQGKHGRAAETFLLGDRERVTEDTAGKELGRAVGKNTLIAGGAGLAVAGGAGMVATGTALAGGAGLAAAGTAGLAAVGAAVPPVLIAAAIVAAATAVAKGTQEAYELEYDKNAASIQKDLHQTLHDEEAPFLKRVGAGFKSDWIALTSTLAGGVRGVAEVIDTEAERSTQKQLEILKKQADEGNENSARLYDIMSKQAFREMSKKEKEKLLKSEGLYNEYLTVISDSEDSFWEKLKKGVKAVAKGVEGAVNTANENWKGQLTESWERKQLKGMDKDLDDKETRERLKNSEAYQKALGETGDPLKAMQSAYLSEKKEKAQARGDLDGNGMVVSAFDKLKLGFKSFTDISDEAIKQSTEFDTRKLKLLAEGKTAEEADQQALEEQRALLNAQMELKLKQTKEYKIAFDKALKEGKSLKDAEKEALNKLKGNKNYLKSFGQHITDGLKGLWEEVKNVFKWGKDKKPESSSADDAAAPIPSVEDGIIYKGGKVVRVSDDDNIIATKAEPVIGDKETRQADAVPARPDIINKFSDENIVEVLSKILSVLDNKDFSPTVNAGGGDAVMNFDGMRVAGAL